MYNIASPEIMSTKFVIHPAGGLPSARTLITNFVLLLFSGLDMLLETLRETAVS